MGAERHFLGWDRDIVTLATAFLTRDWHGGLVDLSPVLALVPTRQSGRRLRERLATFAAAHDTGMLPPRVVAPEFFLEPAAAARGASAAETLAVLADLLKTLNLKQFPHLFPGDLAWNQDFRWALDIAEKFGELRNALGERGLLFRDVPARLEKAFPNLDQWDPQRWVDLVRIEELFLARLRALRLQDPTLAKRAAAENPALPPGITRVVVLAVPDPVPLALTALAKLAAQLPVDVCIHAPAELAGAFDDWGRPRPEAWLTHSVDIPDASIRLVAKPRHQAAAVLQHIETERLPTPDVVVGVPDETVVPFLERLCQARGLRTFNPAGKAVASHAVYHLFKDLGTLLASDAYSAFSSILRNPDFLRYLDTRARGLDTARLLTEADKFQNTFLPETFADVAARVESGHVMPDSPLAAACGALGNLRRRLEQPGFHENALGVLEEVYGARRLSPGNEADNEFSEVAGTLTEQLSRAGSAVLSQLCTNAADRVELLLRLLQGLRYFPEASATDLEIEGWLELPWNDAPHLLLTGFNEGCVPQSVVGHPFLPDRARQALGLLHNEQRFARDIYLFAAMLAWRREAGSVQIIFGKTMDEGDMIRPSRLLFLCPDAALPGRAERLFANVRESQPPVARQLAWRLEPRQAAFGAKISVTAFKQYLACPFRFYLAQVLRMAALDDRKTEMNAMDFGDLCHRVLDDFAMTPALRDATDDRAIAAFLVSAAEERIRTQYGRALSAPLRVQLEALRQRLTHAARVQAEHRRDGWRILRSETSFGKGGELVLDGLAIHGRIDRLDQHDDGRVLVIDYKTSDTARNPEDTHLKTVKDTADLPSFAWFSDAAATRRWLDLQLPLYGLHLRGEFGTTLTAAYFNLPKAVTETRIETWELTPAVLTAAEACAKGVIAAIRQGVFWPPGKVDPRYDDFAALFPAAVEECVNGEGRAGGRIEESAGGGLAAAARARRGQRGAAQS